MILNFDKFSGKVKKDFLDHEEVIDLVSLITDMKPSLPDIFPDDSMSKLVDNLNYYTSQDSVYKISVYFRESDEYHNPDGSITYGKFKSLFKIGIFKIKEGDFKLSEVKEYILFASDIISNVYETSKIIIKLNGERLSIEDFKTQSEDVKVESIKVVIRII